MDGHLGYSSFIVNSLFCVLGRCGGGERERGADWGVGEGVGEGGGHEPFPKGAL
jgi:hypothetical protein